MKAPQMNDGRDCAGVHNGNCCKGIEHDKAHSHVAEPRMQTLLELLNHEQTWITDEEDPWLFESPDDRLWSAPRDQTASGPFHFISDRIAVGPALRAVRPALPSSQSIQLRGKQSV